MQYRILDTTDHQHRGKTIEWSDGDIDLGDIRIETIYRRENSDGTLTVGDPNYLLTLEAI